MSTQIAPRPRTAQQPSRRPVTGPRSRRPAPSSPFRWRRDSPFPGVARDGAPRVHNSFTARNDLPDPGPWAATLAGAIVEVVTGVRQAQQLRRWLLPDLYAALTAVRLSPCARGTTPVHVRTCPIDERKTEAAVIVSTASRTYALALRLEEYRGRWMTTALELA